MGCNNFTQSVPIQHVLTAPTEPFRATKSHECVDKL